MARTLKVFKTHIGFHDLIVAAPSMKAAATAWEASPRLFAQGFAAQTNEPDAVKAALAQRGTVLRRPHGQAGAYKANPDKPTAPKVTTRQKQKCAEVDQARRRTEAKEKKAKAAAEREVQKAAEKELADIERQEAELRERRQGLQKKFRLRSV
jgi:hypothetical protein